jgi:hypothetical protein
LETRKLVLVTVENRVFEELTEDQQSRLERAIALLLAEYAAILKQRQWERNLTQPSLPLPRAEPTQWPIVRWFYRGMRWMQTGSLAAVTNLFGEAEQRDRLHLLEGQPHFLRTSTPTKPAQWPVLEQPDWLKPIAFVPEGTDVTGLQIRMTKSQVDNFVDEASDSLETANSAVDPKGLSLDSFTAEMVDSSWLPEIAIVEARVSEVNYIDNWFIQLLRWIDQGLCWLEQGAKRLWDWLHRAC